jgi:hypothetical protein
LAQSPCGQAGNVFFTAGIGQVDPALFNAIQDRADQMGEADRCRHVGVELPDDPAEIVQMTVGKRQRLQLVSRV